MFWLRFFAVGLVAACIPVVANAFGARFAGLMATVPVILIASMYFLGKDQGPTAVKAGAQGALLGLIGLVALLAVLLYATGRMPQVAALAIAFATWAVVVGCMSQVSLSTWRYLAVGVLTITGSLALVKLGRQTPALWAIAFVVLYVCGYTYNHLWHNWVLFFPMVPLAIIFAVGVAILPSDILGKKNSLSAR